CPNAATNNYVDFLTGNLDDVRGALNIDFGKGRQKLFMSDEASSHADFWNITDTTPGADIAITRSDPLHLGFGVAPITYSTDSTAGNLHDGVSYWTGSGNDTVTIDGTHRRAGQRTTTTLNTGLGDDTVTVN